MGSKLAAGRVAHASASVLPGPTPGSFVSRHAISGGSESHPALSIAGMMTHPAGAPRTVATLAQPTASRVQPTPVQQLSSPAASSLADVQKVMPSPDKEASNTVTCASEFA